LNLITYAIPVFFLMIFIEAFIDYKKKAGFYRLNDSINSLSCGILSELLGLFVKSAFFGIYILLYTNLRVTEIFNNHNVLTLIVLFFLVDFIYYWFHRWAHEINIMWATHIVHHNSEEYNLTTALRQGPFQVFASAPLYLPLAILGFEPVAFIIMRSINTLYQFWIHTRFIGRMGYLEWFLNTPSHHRVHHAKNIEYWDHNYGGILIIWDRMFGTFKKEDEKISFGISRPIESFNPLWSVFHWWKLMINRAMEAPTFGQKVLVFFKGPGWKYEGEGSNEYLNTPDYLTKKFDPRVNASMKRNLVSLFVILVFATVYILLFNKQLDYIVLVPMILAVSGLLALTGRLFNNHTEV